MDEQNQFYNFICELSSRSDINSRDLLRKDSDAIYELITRDHRNNIKISAMHGNIYAYLCVYLPGAKYQNSIPIDQFIKSDSMKQKLLTFGVRPVMERVQETLHPFIVECVDIPLQNNPQIVARAITARWSVNPE